MTRRRTFTSKFGFRKDLLLLEYTHDCMSRAVELVMFRYMSVSFLIAARAWFMPCLQLVSVVQLSRNNRNENKRVTLALVYYITLSLNWITASLLGPLLS